MQTKYIRMHGAGEVSESIGFTLLNLVLYIHGFCGMRFYAADVIYIGKKLKMGRSKFF